MRKKELLKRIEALEAIVFQRKPEQNKIPAEIWALGPAKATIAVVGGPDRPQIFFGTYPGANPSPIAGSWYGVGVGRWLASIDIPPNFSVPDWKKSLTYRKDIEGGANGPG